MKWSALRFGFIGGGWIDGEEATYSGRDRCEATTVDVLMAQGRSVTDAVMTLGVTEVTYYRWRNEYGGLKGDQVKRLKALETENSRLRRAVSDLMLAISKLTLQRDHSLGAGHETWCANQDFNSLRISIASELARGLFAEARKPRTLLMSAIQFLSREQTQDAAATATFPGRNDLHTAGFVCRPGLPIRSRQ